MYAVSEIFVARYERFESVSRMDSHDTELEYLTTGEGGGGHVDLEGTLSRTSEFLSASTISLIVSNLSQNGGDTYGWRKKRAKRISCLRIFSIIFPTLPRTPFHSLLNCLSTRFFAVFRDILHRYSKTWFFAPSLDKRGRSIFFSKE